MISNLLYGSSDPIPWWAWVIAIALVLFVFFGRGVFR